MGTLFSAFFAFAFLFGCFSLRLLLLFWAAARLAASLRRVLAMSCLKLSWDFWIGMVCLFHLNWIALACLLASLPLSLLPLLSAPFLYSNKPSTQNSPEEKKKSQTCHIYL